MNKNEKISDELKAVVVKAMEDEKFAAELKQSPREALKNYNLSLSDADLQVIESAESLEDLQAAGSTGKIFW